MITKAVATIIQDTSPLLGTGADAAAAGAGAAVAAAGAAAGVAAAGAAAGALAVSAAAAAAAAAGAAGAWASADAPPVNSARPRAREANSVLMGFSLRDGWARLTAPPCRFRR